VITAGNGTNHIVVDFSAGAQSGNVTVAGINLCGEGPLSPPFPVTVNPIPPAPVVTANGAQLTSSANSGNQWYYAGNAISGATGKYFTATQTGYYWCTVTLNGCTSPISNKVYVLITGTEEQQADRIHISPVPNDGMFTVSLSARDAGRCTVEVMTLTGEVIWRNSFLVSLDQVALPVAIKNAAGGLYLVKVSLEDDIFIRKIVIRK
jgi:hypothetical protein